MKKGIIACLIASVIIGNPLSFRMPSSFQAPKASIVGKITPAEGADVAWIIGRKDSLRAIVVLGNFSQNVSPGGYKLVVVGKMPYKDATLVNLDVKQDQVLDIGEIILQK